MTYVYVPRAGSVSKDMKLPKASVAAAVNCATSPLPDSVLAEPVHPSFPPGHVLSGEVFQGRTADEMIQAPPSGNVPHD